MASCIDTVDFYNCSANFLIQHDVDNDFKNNCEHECPMECDRIDFDWKISGYEVNNICFILN